MVFADGQHAESSFMQSQPRRYARDDFECVNSRGGPELHKIIGEETPYGEGEEEYDRTRMTQVQPLSNVEWLKLDRGCLLTEVN